MFVSAQPLDRDLPSVGGGTLMTSSNPNVSGPASNAGEIAAEFRMQHRQGDAEFHHRLLEAYGGICAITGTNVAEALQIAPINPTAVAGLNDFSNALLLRADIHNLFDARLLSIEPIALTVVVAPRLESTSYAELQGRKVVQPERVAWRPSRQAIDAHYRQFMRLWHAEEADATARTSLRRIAPLRPDEPLPSLGAPTVVDSPAPEPIERFDPSVRLVVQVKSWVNGVHFSPDGNLLATGSWDGSVRLWRPNDGYLVQTMPSGMGEVNGVAFSPDGRMLVTASRNRAVQFWRVGDGALLRNICEGDEAHEGAVFSVSFSPTGDMVASGSWDRTVRIWRATDGSLVHTLRDHRGAVNSVAYSPNGKLIASGSHDRLVRLWRAADGVLAGTFQGHTDAVFCVSFSPDGRLLASAGSDQMIRLWRVVDGTLVRTLEGHTGAIFSVAFSTDGQTLVSGDYNRAVRFWQVSDGMLLHNIQAHGEGITSMAFSPDGRTLASGSFDASVRLWQVGP